MASVWSSVGSPNAPTTLSVSNSLSGRHWELDQGPAVGDRTDIVQLGTGHHVSAGEGQRRVALQRRVAAYLVVGGQTPSATQRCLNPGFSERIGNSRRTGWWSCFSRIFRFGADIWRSSSAKDEGCFRNSCWAADASGFHLCSAPRCKRELGPHRLFFVPNNLK